MASNSSSKSRRVSWQPSQEENFQTASLGFRVDAMSDLRSREPIAKMAEGHHWPVPADEICAELAMAAMADRAFHVALHREVDGLVGNAGVLQFGCGKAHHDLW